MKNSRSHNPIIPKGLLYAFMVLLGPVSAEAATQSYQYYRFTPTKLRNSTTEMQMSEFRLRLGTTTVSSTATLTTTNSTTAAGDAEGVNKLIDSNLATKWFSGAIATVTFGFTAPTPIDNYTYATGNDFDSRDPVSWILEGSPDNATWTTLDIVTDAPGTVVRNTWLPDFTIPQDPPPSFSSFDASPQVVINGGKTLMEWTSTPADDFVINPGALDAGSNDILSDVIPPANADTVYTVTATNPAGTATSSYPVRSVAGGSATYRYVRFTPTVLRNPATANSVQLAELTFISGETELVPVTATNPGGSNPTTEGPANAIDGLAGSKWLDYNKKPLIVDFGTSQTFDGYYLVTGGDAPERDPIRWTLEGSDDLTTWKRIEDLTAFDAAVPLGRSNSTQNFPLPGGSLPPIVSSFTVDTVKVVAGDPVVFTWTTTEADSVTLTGVPGTLAASDTMSILPTASGLYTLTASSPAGFKVTKSVNVAVAASAPATPNYASFDTENGELSLAGSALILNDFANTPHPSNTKRIRLTPDLTGRSGAAWFPRRLALGAGFDTTFGFMITKKTAPPGADGLSLVVQNDPTGDGITGSGEAGFANAFTIGFDTYQNTGEASSALLKVSLGTTLLKTVNLAATTGVTVNTTVSPPTLTTLASTGTPHTVHATMAADTLNVWFDGVQVVTNLAVALSTSTAVTPDGMGYVGFAGRTGGLSAANDVTSWTLSTTGATPTAVPLAITAYSLNAATGQGSLTWASNAGKTYQITSSTNMTAFTTIVAGSIASGGTTTTKTFTFTPGTKGFFRVEQL